MSSQDTRARPARRQYTVAFKRELVERSLQPGASVSGIALEGGINTNMLFRWRREHLRAGGRMQGHGAAQAVLVREKVAQRVSPTLRQELRASGTKADGLIEIEIGGAHVRLHGSVDDSNLRCVLRTLRGLA